MLPGLTLLPRMVDRRAALNPQQYSFAWILIAAWISIFFSACELQRPQSLQGDQWLLGAYDRVSENSFVQGSSHDAAHETSLSMENHLNETSELIQG